MYNISRTEPGIYKTLKDNVCFFLGGVGLGEAV